MVPGLSNRIYGETFEASETSSDLPSVSLKHFFLVAAGSGPFTRRAPIERENTDDHKLLHDVYTLCSTGPKTDGPGSRGQLVFDENAPPPYTHTH